MTIIAVIQRKGGSGKTTIAGNLVGEFTAAGRRVRALDLDPQRSLARWGGRGEGVLARLTEVVESAAGTDPVARAMEVIARAHGEADLVIVDTPPSFDELSSAALLGADVVLIPCQPSPLDLEAADDMLEVVEDARRFRDGRPLRVGLVPSRVRPGVGLSTKIAFALDERGELVLAKIADRVANAEAALLGLTTREYQPRSPAAKEWDILRRQVEKLL